MFEFYKIAIPNVFHFYKTAYPNVCIFTKRPILMFEFLQNGLSYC